MATTQMTPQEIVSRIRENYREQSSVPENVSGVVIGYDEESSEYTFADQNEIHAFDSAEELQAFVSQYLAEQE